MGEFKIPDPAALSDCKSPFPAPPHSCYNYDDIITIRVKDGTQHKDYQAFRELLRWHSAYFAAALDPSGGFNTGLKTLEIECGIEVFAAFHCWLHTGRLREPHQSTNASDLENTYLSPLTICKVWVFADFRGIPELGNCAIDALHERCVASWALPGSQVKYVYSHTPAGSKLRSCIADFHTMICRLELFQSFSQNDHTVAFLHDVLPGITRSTDDTRLDREQLTAIDRCRWHDHSVPGGQLRLESRK